MTKRKSNESDDAKSEDLMSVDYWRSLGIEPVVIESEKDFDKVAERVKKEIDNGNNK
ncbi:hypothetical protein NDI37_21995 [Funiculus sociatus GB2-A5]|uniref:Uncharacterized protein n=1 Tax=Funiculus sociatus GB2-A5 TaxID=2933946 RepID=A0ABV0JWW4_9CYAN|nr:MULTISPECIES: hypothetical protein [unclassified Trichocoleus]MBD2006482.1 hypothetical protein [Trichocoleus sp. FACHB-40]MBD2060769.1 hypothetical protein [Trichocoleus sp. FACHB-6]